MFYSQNHERRITTVEQRAKSNTHRLDKLEPIVEEIHTMSKIMVHLVEEVRHTNESVCDLDAKVDRMDSRVNSIEQAPTEEIKKYKNTTINTIISTIVAALTTGLILLIAQYL